MKKFARLMIVISFTVLAFTASGQANNHLSERLSGKENQSIVLIPDFVRSNLAWRKAKTIYDNDYTCYTLTLATIIIFFCLKGRVH